MAFEYILMVLYHASFAYLPGSPPSGSRLVGSCGVVLGVWFSSCFDHFLFPYRVPHFHSLYFISPQSFTSSCPSPHFSFHMFTGFSYFHDSNPLNTSQCLGSVIAFSLGYPPSSGLSWDNCQTNFSSSQNFIFL